MPMRAAWRFMSSPRPATLSQPDDLPLHPASAAAAPCQPCPVP